MNEAVHLTTQVQSQIWLGSSTVKFKILQSNAQNYTIDYSTVSTWVPSPHQWPAVTSTFDIQITI